MTVMQYVTEVGALKLLDPRIVISIEMVMEKSAALSCCIAFSEIFDFLGNISKARTYKCIMDSHI